MTLIRIGESKDTSRDYAEFWGQMYPVVTKVVEQSFADVAMRNPTRSEVKRRTEAAKKFVEVMRGDFHMSVPRIKDILPRALNCFLLGISLDLAEVSRRSCW